MLQSNKIASFETLERRPLLGDLSLVIPTLGRAILAESLYWIAVGDVWPAELIVVDQGASPQVAAWLQALHAIGLQSKHVPSMQRGRAAGLNRGLECVKTPFVAVTDDDCFARANWLSLMAKRLAAAPGAIITGQVEAGNEDIILTVTSRESAIYRRPRLKFDALSGGNMGTSMAVVGRVGPFDEHPSLRTAEDGEWAYRALRAGVPIIYAPDIVVRHMGWRDEDERTDQYASYARSHGGFYGKYLRQGDWFIALRAVVHHYRALRRWVRGVMTGNPELTRYGRAYLTGLLPGIIAGMRRGNEP